MNHVSRVHASETTFTWHFEFFYIHPRILHLQQFIKFPVKQISTPSYPILIYVFFYSKEIFFNIERNDMLIQNICYLSVITILNCQLPDCNENMKKNKTLTYPCKGLIIFLFFFISVILSLKEFKTPSFWWLKWQYSWKRTCV